MVSKLSFLKTFLVLALVVHGYVMFGQDNPVTTFPWTEDFEDIWIGDDPASPEDWSQLLVSGHATWEQGSWPVHNGFGAATTEFTDYAGHQLLITPAIDLGTDANSTYKLKFWLRGSAMYGSPGLKVYVSDDNTAAASFTDAVLSLEGWETPSGFEEQVIDLSAYQGVKYIGFEVINDDTYQSYDLTIDDVKVMLNSTNPVMLLSDDAIAFSPVKVNETVSKDITITNDGGADLVISASSVAVPFSCDYTGTIAPGVSEDVTIKFTPTTVDNFAEELSFTMEGAATGNNSLSVSGVSYPENYILEGFEGWSMPDGWQSNSTQGEDWSTDYSNGLAGSHSCYLRYDYVDGASHARLITPNIQLSDDAYITFYAKMSGDDPVTFKVQYSDNGADFQDLQTVQLTEEYQLFTVDLSAVSGSHCFIGFYAETAEEYSRIYVDEIILPPLFEGGVPAVASNPEPADAAIDIQPSASLTWNEVADADGYKVYFGETDPPTQMLADITETTYDAGLSFGKTYYWQVVPYNGTGVAEDCPVWSFTMFDDPTVNVFPWTETFENDWVGEPATPQGWSQINVSGLTVWEKDVWPVHNGSYAARGNVDEGAGHQLLITPAINLGDDADVDYRLRFWLRGGGWTNAAHLKVCIGDANTSIDDFTEELLYIEGFDIPTGFEEQTIDLSAYSGTKYIAFLIMNDEQESALGLSIDDVLIEATPTIPVITLSDDALAFAPVKINETDSVKINITNEGTVDMEITGVTVNAPFSCDYTGTISGGTSVDAYIYFTPAVVGEFTETLEFNIDGTYSGDEEVSLNGLAYAQDYTMEGFEGDFLPLAWSNISGQGEDWDRTMLESFEKGHAARLSYKSSFSGSEASKATLVTPDIAIDQNAILQFYTKKSGSDDVVLKVQYSNDGTTFQDLETVAVTLNYQLVTVDLSSLSEDHCHLAFYGETAEEFSTIYVDAVILPPLYSGEVPPVAMNPDPADDAQNVNSFAVLSWDEIVNADGYKVYFGESNPPTTEIADVTESTYAPVLDYSKTYYWQVVPYNATGDAVVCPVWSFETIDDPTIATFPYIQDFEEGLVPPLGWRNAGDKEWEPGEADEAHGGSNCAIVSDYSYNGVSILMTPSVELPEDFRISFWWQDAHVGNMKGELRKEINAPKIAYKDSTFFELSIDEGANWITLDTLCPVITMDDYENVSFDLTAYGNETVLFRWREVIGDVTYPSGVALDDIIIEAKPTSPIAELNKTQWDAGTIAVSNTVSSGDEFTLTNAGAGTLTITSADFSGDDFTTNFDNTISLSEGETHTFGFTYEPSQAGTANETFTITTNGTGNDVLVINLIGEAVTLDVVDGDFENALDFSLEFEGWKIVDGDQGETYGFENIAFPHAGEAMGFIAFNPSQTEPAMTSESIQPHSGDMFAACFASTTPPNNDWIITPKTTLGSNSMVSLWVKTFFTNEGAYPLEKYNVLVSTTDDNISSFTCISGTSPLVAPEEAWTEVSFDLSDYDGQDVYVAIQCVSDDAFIFMVDDVEFASADAVNNLDASAVMTYPNPVSDVLNIINVEGTTVSLYDIMGNQLDVVNKASTECKINMGQYPQGTYILRVVRDNQIIDTMKVVK